MVLKYPLTQRQNWLNRVVSRDLSSGNPLRAITTTIIEILKDALKINLPPALDLKRVTV